MKKILIGIFVISSLAFGKLQDGKYYVEAEKAEWGWKPFTYMVVKNSEIIEVKHDRKNKKGEIATKDKKYNQSMAKKQGIGIKDAVSKLERDFMKSKDIEEIDSIAGATSTSKEFKAMMRYLVHKAEKGQSGQYKIPNKELK
ncbi:FMN-binding protein [Ilyobacter polytropus]|uniref:FMN-binding domain protein n=1 Tax=Ilyobacter polytropus (strain ATCC 51220 / DSM 2926 / LMG 16218 / CuHBu1) TaxID=572544 RepID=E3H8K6_ILYPC|nr:FMN-binding protein [Ilyobacter polytropus]ADO82988.1 FMN-binding domain protein [Ilyobacter polytropus DSM 2926]